MDEAQQTALRALKDEVLRKVGRNLLLNQEIEHLLKSILGIARIEGTIADAAARLEARQLRPADLALEISGTAPGND